MTIVKENIADLKHIHFVGISGAGTAPLAGIMLKLGYYVSGSDLKLNRQSLLLKEQGAYIHEGHSEENLSADAEMLVYSSAASDDNPEIEKAQKLNIPCIRRGVFLAELSSLYSRTVAISGSHGKTTITAMLVWILRRNSIPCTYLIGGKVNGFNEYEVADNDILISEVDESDGTNALFSPYLGIVSNVEDDHSWSVGGTGKLLVNFKKFAMHSENLLYAESKLADELFDKHPEAGSFNPDNYTGHKAIKFSGFMRINAVLACLAAEKLGITKNKAIEAVNEFPGVARRMNVHFESTELILIEDYAHHPTEVAGSIELLRSNYPQHHLRVIFQPHRYARLEKYIDRFAKELVCADSIFTVPVFAAWTETGIVNSKNLTKKIGSKAIYLDTRWENMPQKILADKPEKLLLAVMGAGDIEKLIPEINNYLRRNLAHHE